MTDGRRVGGQVWGPLAAVGGRSARQCSHPRAECGLGSAAMGMVAVQNRRGDALVERRRRCDARGIVACGRRLIARERQAGGPCKPIPGGTWRPGFKLAAARDVGKGAAKNRKKRCASFGWYARPLSGLAWPCSACARKALATAQPAFQRGSPNRPRTSQGTRPAAPGGRRGLRTLRGRLPSMLQFYINAAKANGLADMTAAMPLANEGTSPSPGRRGGRG